MKNVIWWIGVKNEQYAEKYGGWEWMDISRKTWEYWCKKNDVLFVPFEKPIEEDLTRFRINWQKAIFVFDEMDRRKIDYDQICQIDCTHMIKWDAPNFFEMTDHKLTAVRDTDNLRWIGDSIDGYEKFFDYKLDRFKYVSSSPMIFNEQHREVFQSFKELYYDNVDEFVDLQDKTVHKGTEQTPLNYWLQKNNIELNLTLPFSFKLTHIHRKDMFKHNWQLNEDPTPFFIKYGNDWVFTGIPKDQRTDIMKQTWEMVKHHYDENHILNKLVHKDEWCKTTSRKFKEDILRIFSNSKELNCLEIGSCRGDSTRVFAECFKTVHAFERSDENLAYVKEKCSDVTNVKYNKSDVYENFEIPDGIDVAFIDAGHSTDLVKFDIKRFLKKNPKMILIFDDYGQADGSVKNAINDSNLTISRHIGEYNGFTCKNLSGKEITFVAREGVICNMG